MIVVTILTYRTMGNDEIDVYCQHLKQFLPETMVREFRNNGHATLTTADGTSEYKWEQTQ